MQLKKKFRLRYKQFAKKSRAIIFRMHQPENVNPNHVFSCETMFFSKQRASVYKQPALVSEKRIVACGHVLMKREGFKLIPYYYHTPHTAAIFLKCRGYFKVYIRSFLGGSRSDHNKVILFYTPQIGNYYHFVIDLLLRAKHIQSKYNEDPTRSKILIPGYACFSEWQLTYLKLLGFAPESIIDSDPPILIDELFTPPPESLCNTSDLETIREFRDLLVERANSTPSGQMSDKIYISRAHPGGIGDRGVLNESELTKFLTERGFSILHLEQMSVTEQIKAFANAKLVIGPHGAGLANIIFCKQAKIIELCHENGHWNHAYQGMCELLEFEYIKFASTGPRSPRSGNFEISLSQLSEAISDHP